MADFILVDGDKANYSPQFGAAMVTVQFGKLTATGSGKINDKKICIKGDESSAKVDCSYMTLQFLTQGSGTIEISPLKDSSSHIASDTLTGGKKVMLKGSYFKAKFTVKKPAEQRNPDGTVVFDTTSEYSGGRGYFLSTNVKIKGT